MEKKLFSDWVRDCFFSGSGQVGPGRVKKVIRRGSRIAILEPLKGVLE